MSAQSAAATDRATRGSLRGAPAEQALAVYVHWPFCRAKCPYCDFNSHVRAEVDQDRWRAALLAELAHYAALTPGRRVTSVFFGGGTPSLMPPATAGAVLDAVARHWRTDDQIEVTLEANPTSAEAAAFAGFAAAGVNRLSIGVQSLEDAQLRFLGRQHDASEALRAVALARRAVPRFSFDLIYGLPDQMPDAWRQALLRALDEGPEHLSVYQLTIEENTPFHGAWRRGELSVPGEETAAALYEATQELLQARGLPAYEISNHARPGAECRHNLAYWRYGDYAGVGPGAHGRLTISGEKRATRQHRAPEAWLKQVEAKGHATRQDAPVARAEQVAECLMMGLRLAEGVPEARLRDAFGAELEQLVDAARLRSLLAAGYLRREGGRLYATAEGRLRLDAVLCHLLA